MNPSGVETINGALTSAITTQYDALSISSGISSTDWAQFNAPSSGGGTGLPFVATNEWYVDTLAVADATNRIFPTILGAITDANGVLPATLPIVIRLREGQTHAMALGGVGIDGTRNILIYSHDADIPSGTIPLTLTQPAATLSMSGTLAASVTTPVLQFTGLKLTHTGASITFPGPWQVHFRLSVTTFMNIILDTSATDVGLLFTEFDAVKSLVFGSTAHPLVVTNSGGVGSATTKFVRSRVQMGDYNFAAPVAMAPCFVSGTTAGLASTSFSYEDTLLEIPVLPGVDDVASVWSTEGLMNVDFVGQCTLLFGQVGGTVNVFAEVGVGENRVSYQHLDVSLATQSADTSTVMTWGARTDGEHFGGPFPPPLPNRIRLLRSNTISGGLPVDMPNGTLADDPGTERDTSWVKRGDPITAAAAGAANAPEIWLTGDGGSHWSQTTTVGVPSAPMDLLNAGPVVSTTFPLRLTTDGIYMVSVTASGAQVSGAGSPAGALFQIDALVDVVGGVVALLGVPTTTTLVDTTGGAYGVVIAIAATGFGLTVSQGASPASTVLWDSTSHTQEVSG